MPQKGWTPHNSGHSISISEVANLENIEKEVAIGSVGNTPGHLSPVCTGQCVSAFGGMVIQVVHRNVDS